MSIAAGTEGNPPSIDKSNKITPFIPIASARGGKNRRARRCNHVWYYPGKGTPSYTRNAVSPPFVVKLMTEGSDAVVGSVARRKKQQACHYGDQLGIIVK